MVVSCGWSTRDKRRSSLRAVHLFIQVFFTVALLDFIDLADLISHQAASPGAC